MSRWRRVEKMPIRIDSTLGVERYIVTAISDRTDMRHYGAATFTEAQEIAKRMRAEPLTIIVTLARVEDAWKKV